MSARPVPVRVISLARAERRRGQVSAEFARLGMDFGFFDGVDGRAEEARLMGVTSPEAWRRNMGGPTAPGHLGCYASHVALWAEIGAGADEIVLVCEDDVMLHDDFPQALAAALAVKCHWDIVRFAKVRAKLPVVQGTVGPYRLNAYVGPFTGNACYLIKRDVARRLAEEFWPIQRAHDHELNRFFVHDIRLLGLEPFAAHAQDEGESFITGHAMADARKFPWYRRLPYYRQKAANYLRRIAWLARHGMLWPRTRVLAQPPQMP